MPRSSMLLAALVATAGCGGGDGVAITDTGDLVAGLCEAEDHAAAGRLDAARAAFQDRAHGGLHELAADLQERNPMLAGQLLEAKEAVERAMQPTAEAEPDVLTSRLSSLLASVQASLAYLRRPAGGCT